MKNILYTITSILLITLIIHLTVGWRPVSAVTESYQITNGIDTGYPTLLNGNVFFYKYLTFKYTGGKVILSSNPDGTGDITIGDMMQVFDHYGTKKLTYQGYSANCTVFNDTIPAQDISSIVYTNTYPGTASEGLNNVLVRFSHWCYRQKHIGPLYLVVMSDGQTTPTITATPTETATPTPTASPSPTPTPTPLPFLRLPWDYESKKLSFDEAAMAMSAYFDHEYPLLGGGMDEPGYAGNTIVNYKSDVRRTLPYTNHDGYDYARQAQVYYGDKVLAAADGNARYVGTCKNCGNMIVIDHGNGYQTRYLHLQKEGLISTDSAQIVPVHAGEAIGLVGSSGNSSGPHIHFGLYQDKDKDGVFDIPDGATDPFGWDGKTTDPWESYQFEYHGANKTGNKSYYLWNKRLASIKTKLDASGGEYGLERFKISVPSGATPDNSEIRVLPAPAVADKNNLTSIGSTFIVEIADPLGSLLKTFSAPLKVEALFGGFDLGRIRPETLGLYSSEDGETWVKEAGIVDRATGKITASVNHLTQFAVMGERIDSQAPETKATATGAAGIPGFFHGDVTVKLAAVDNIGGVGLDKTLYSLDGEDWKVYDKPFIVKGEGSHKIDFYSWDKDGNIEELKNLQISIDTSIPEAVVRFDMAKARIVVEAKQTGDTVERLILNKLNKSKQLFILSDNAGNKLRMTTDLYKGEEGNKLTIYSLRYNDGPEINTEDVSYAVESEYGKNKTFKELEQMYKVRGMERLTTSYDLKSDLTRIIIRKQREIQKESKKGIILLNIYSDRGTIKYSY